MAYNTISVADSATLIVAANSARKGLLIVNAATSTVYLGPDANITTANGIPLLQNGSFNNAGLDAAFRGSVYGIVASGTADVRYWEWIQ
jgi:hypothetical protein